MLNAARVGRFEAKGEFEVEMCMCMGSAEEVDGVIDAGKLCRARALWLSPISPS